MESESYSIAEMYALSGTCSEAILIGRFLSQVEHSEGEEITHTGADEYERYEQERKLKEYVSSGQVKDLITGEAPCGAHVFEGFFGLENGPVKSDKSQEKTLFGKEMPEDASRHPKPTSYPQTRQDTVVRVFPMESSN